MVRCDGCPKSPLHLSDLGSVTGTPGIGRLFDGLHAINQVAVQVLGPASKLLRLTADRILPSRVSITEQASMKIIDLVNVVLDFIDTTINLSTMIQDGVRIWRGRLGVIVVLL